MAGARLFSPRLRHRGPAAAPAAASRSWQTTIPTIHDKTAVPRESVGAPPLVDVNKRTGDAAGLFLQANGWRLEAERGDADAFMTDVAAGRLRREGIRIRTEGHAGPHGRSG